MVLRTRGRRVVGRVAVGERMRGFCLWPIVEICYFQKFKCFGKCKRFSNKTKTKDLISNNLKELKKRTRIDTHLHISIIANQPLHPSAQPIRGGPHPKHMHKQYTLIQAALRGRRFKNPLKSLRTDDCASKPRAPAVQQSSEL